MADMILETMAKEVIDDLQGRFLTFNIDDVFYGIELLHTIEIISIQPITKAPNLPRYIKGITNLRGKVVPIIDVRLKFGQPERPYDDKTCIIVVMINEHNVGLIVDSVYDVITVNKEESSPPPEFGSIGNSERFLRSIARVGDRIVMNIDIEKFFQSDLQIH